MQDFKFTPMTEINLILPFESDTITKNVRYDIKGTLEYTTNERETKTQIVDTSFIYQGHTEKRDKESTNYKKPLEIDIKQERPIFIISLIAISLILGIIIILFRRVKKLRKIT